MASGAHHVFSADRPEEGRVDVMGDTGTRRSELTRRSLAAVQSARVVNEDNFHTKSIGLHVVILLRIVTWLAHPARLITDRRGPGVMSIRVSAQVPGYLVGLLDYPHKHKYPGLPRRRIVMILPNSLTTLSPSLFPTPTWSFFCTIHLLLLSFAFPNSQIPSHSQPLSH